LAPFIRFDNLSYKEIKQYIQKFIFDLNTTSRWGGQSPFTNLTLDLYPPKHIAKEGVICGGKITDTCYGDYAKEMMLFNKAFLEVMTKGDYNGNIFSFPIPTYNVTEDFPWESEVGEQLLLLTAKYGAPYFQNFINSDLNPEDVRSMCCRLRMDLRELKKKTGGLFGAGDLTGSIGVVTINIARLAYEAKNEKDFFNLLEKYSDMCSNCLEIKRKCLNKSFEQGFFPFSKKFLKNGYNGHFSTIGLVGTHEGCLNLLGKDKGIETEEGLLFSKKILLFLQKKTKSYQKETGNVYNLEATPAEGTSYRLARIDKKKHNDIFQSGENEPYYTNSTNLPVDFTNDLFTALEHQNNLQPLYTGGTVFHVMLGEQITDTKALKNLMMKIFRQTKLPFVSITPSFSICPEHGYITGEKPVCPKCGQETAIYTRVVGYYRPVKNWNRGKKEEFKQRKSYTFK
jgi:ribonucleoside-triphosphate reductase